MLTYLLYSSYSLNHLLTCVEIAEHNIIYVILKLLVAYTIL